MDNTKFQMDVNKWLIDCFGEETANSIPDRNWRFLEESLELVQSTGCTKGEAHALVDYVFEREVGEPFLELGGVMITLAALCYATHLKFPDAAQQELARITEPRKMAAIRAKQASKLAGQPLPGSTK